MTSTEFNAMFKEPSDAVEQNAVYAEHGLKYYLPGEELLNALTHAVGIVFGVIGLVFMLLKATTPTSIAAAVLCSIGFIALYSFSTAYHACTNLNVKSVLRRVDYCSVNFIVIACGTGVSLLGVNRAAYYVYGVCYALCVVSIVLCVVNFKKFRMLAFAMNFVIGALLFSNYFISGIGASNVVLILNLAGIASVLIGAAIFGIKKRYIHTVFHVFVLVGPVLFWVANYLLLN